MDCLRIGMDAGGHATRNPLLLRPAPMSRNPSPTILMVSRDGRPCKRDPSGLCHALSYRFYQWPIRADRKKADEIIAQLSGLRKQILDVIPNLRYLFLSGAQCPVRGDHPVRVPYLFRHWPL